MAAFIRFLVILAAVLIVLNYVFGISPEQVASGIRSMLGTVVDFFRGLGSSGVPAQ